MRRGRCVRCGKTTSETRAGFRDCKACWQIRLEKDSKRMRKLFPPIPDDVMLGNWPVNVHWKED